MNIFDILGPVMVGPSSSHTAGAVRIGFVSRKLLGDEPIKADIYLHGSFASTGIGHGTDKAIVAGLLGMFPDDIRIPESKEIASEKGLSFKISTINLKGVHPNTALVELYSNSGKHVKVMASSLGGGRIKVIQLDDIETDFSGESPTLIVNNIDKPGYIAEVTSMLSKYTINVATMQLYRNQRGGTAVMIIETDQDIPEECIEWLEGLKGVLKVTYLKTDIENN